MSRPRTATAAARRRAPKYLSIHRELEERIASGRLPPGSRLPSQRELADSFGVTLMTLRQALALLEADGLLVAKRGSGTYVSPRPFAYDLGPLRSLAQEVREQGVALTTRVVSAGVVPAPAPVAARLGVAGGRVFALERVRLVDGRPVVRQSSFLPEPLGRRAAKADLARRSLYDVLHEDLGVRVARAVETIQPVVLSGRDAALLARHPGAPALLSQRLTYDEGDRPVIDDRALLPGDGPVIRAERVSDAVRVTYRLTGTGAP